MAAFRDQLNAPFCETRDLFVFLFSEGFEVCVEQIALFR